MAENFRVQLRHPVLVFIASFALLLVGCSIGIHWHPSKTATTVIAVSGALLIVVHEVYYGFLWVSLTAWWIGSRRASNSAFNQRGPLQW